MLSPNHVADGDHRKVGSVRSSRRGVEAHGTGRPPATPEQVGAHDEVALRVKRLAWADEVIPPAEPAASLDATLVGPDPVYRARRVLHVAPSGGMRITAQGMADQNRVIPCRVEI